LATEFLTGRQFQFLNPLEIIEPSGLNSEQEKQKEACAEDIGIASHAHLQQPHYKAFHRSYL